MVSSNAVFSRNLFSDTLVDLEVEAEKEAEAVKGNLITYRPGKLGPGLPHENGAIYDILGQF